ncbi:flagellar basal body rod protein FlgG, partial [Staphylococcus equorum]|nr:flagellar basal body rod protein FlgG [Staphylococcus equorum]
YTRDGNFKMSSDGTIVTTDGYQLQPQIQIPEGATNVTIGPDGSVSASLAGQTEVSQLGKIEIANFINPAGLQAEGNNLLTETASSGQPQ